MQFIAAKFTEPPEKLLTLCGRSIVGSGRNIVTSIVPHTGSRWVDYGLMPFHSPSIIQDAMPKIVDASLVLILRKW